MAGYVSQWGHGRSLRCLNECGIMQRMTPACLFAGRPPGTLSQLYLRVQQHWLAESVLSTGGAVRLRQLHVPDQPGPELPRAPVSFFRDVPTDRLPSAVF